MRSARAFRSAEGGGVAAPPRHRHRREPIELDGWPPPGWDDEGSDDGGRGGDGGGGGGGGDGDRRHDPWDGMPRPGSSELALVLGLVCICTLFLVFCAVALVLTQTADEWPPPGAPAPPDGLLASTLLLAACSASLVRAHAAERAQDRASARKAATTAAVLGLSFLAVQAYLWSELVRAEAPSSNGYVAFFFLLTGLHAVHVAGGIVFLGRTLARLAREPVSAATATSLRLVGLYWHVMGAIWVAVFAILYLLR